MRSSHALARLAPLLTVFVASGSGAAEIVKHSGTVVAVDEAANRMVIAEVGPWRVRQGVTEITRLPVTVTPSTEFAIVRRYAIGPGGFAHEFAEDRLVAWDVAAGDFVTVECRHQGDRLVAVKVVVVDVRE